MAKKSKPNFKQKLTTSEPFEVPPAEKEATEIYGPRVILPMSAASEPKRITSIDEQLTEIGKRIDDLLARNRKEERTDGYSYIRTGLGILTEQAIPLIKSGLKALNISE